MSLENEDVFKHLSLHQESLVTSTFSEEACSLEEHNTDAELATRSNGRFNTCLVTTDDGSCDVVPCKGLVTGSCEIQAKVVAC